MKETKQCPFCGETIEADALQCPICGEDLPKPEPVPEPEPEPVPEPEPIPEPEPEPIPEPEPEPEPVPEPIVEPEPAPIPEQKPAPIPVAPPKVKKTKKGGVKALIIGLCVVLVAAVAGLIWCLWPFGGGGSVVGYDVEYLPFRASATSQWGLISPSGEVLINDEFNEMPTVAINGRFLVRNGAGLWDIYTAEKHPKKVAGDFVSAGMFIEKVMPVAEMNNPIQLIDLNGKVVATLDEIDGKPVSECRNFVNGLAVVKAGNYYGAVDTQGKMVIEPRYFVLEPSSGGKLLAIDKKYESESDMNNVNYTILDSKGEEVGVVKGRRVSYFNALRTSYRTSDLVVNDLLAAVTTKNDEQVMGLMRLDGDWQVEPSGKTVSITQNRGKWYIFYNGEGMGLMDGKGEVKIRAKYDFLEFIDNDVLLAKEEDASRSMLIDLNGKEIGHDEYLHALSSFDGKHIFVQTNNNEWELVDKKGKSKELKTNIYYVDFNGSNYIVTSGNADSDDNDYGELESPPADDL